MSAQTFKIFTERLILDNITVEDAETIVELRSNPRVYKFFTNPKKITVNEHLNWYRNSYLYDDNRFDFAARNRKSKEFVGVFGLKYLGNQTAEINYILVPERQGMGYAREAVTVLMEWAKESRWKCSKIIATIHKDNIDSLKFIKKLGYIFEEEVEDFKIFIKKM